MLSIRQQGNLYTITFSHPDRDQFNLLVESVKEIGAEWDRQTKSWILVEKKRADILLKCKAFSGTPSALLESIRKEKAALLGLPPFAESPVPDGLKLRKHQEENLDFVAQRNGSLIAWEQRTGKSPFAIACVNSTGRAGLPVLVGCPAHLKYKWYTDFKGDSEAGKPAWLNFDASVGIAKGDYFPPTDIVIINYDIFHRHKQRLDSRTWGWLFLDEPHSHMCNPKAKRTIAIYGGSKGRGKDKQEWQPVHAKRSVCLTGTPISSKPQDMWPTLNYLDPKRWPSLHWFEQEYCSSEYRDQWMKGRDGKPVCRKIRVLGEPTKEQMEKLNKRLNATVMSRIRLRDVMDIEPVMRRVIEVDIGAGDSIRALAKAEESTRHENDALRAAVELAKATEDHAEYVRAIRNLADFEKREREHTSALRQKIGLAKVPYVIDHVRYILNSNPEQKVLVFAHHRCVIEALVAAAEEFLPNGVLHHYGKTRDEDKQVFERRIQGDDSIRIGVIGITSGGEGLTLSRATWIVFAEEDGIPKNVRQCEARPWDPKHTEPYMVDHIVARGSTDATIAKRMVKRMAIADTALDAGLSLDEPIDWIEDHRLPTLPELEKETTPYQRTAYGYGLSKLVANPRHYNVTDLHLIIASRLAGKELKGRAAAYARWLCRTYLGASDDEPVKLPDRSF